MKRFFSILAPVFLFSILFPKNILATSGCCSEKHNGVSCSAGPQSNGHVICADGWRGSSCLYSNASECGGYTAPVISTKPVATKAPVATPKPTPLWPATPTITPTSTPTATIEPSPTPQGASTSSGSVVGELVGVALTGFLGWKALKFLGRKAANG